MFPAWLTSQLLGELISHQSRDASSGITSAANGDDGAVGVSFCTRCRLAALLLLSNKTVFALYAGLVCCGCLIRRARVHGNKVRPARSERISLLCNAPFHAAGSTEVKRSRVPASTHWSDMFIQHRFRGTATQILSIFTDAVQACTHSI